MKLTDIKMNVVDNISSGLNIEMTSWTIQWLGEIAIDYVCNISKTSASVSSGFPNTRKRMKARGRWKPLEKASRSKPKLKSRKRNKDVKIYAN